MVKLIVVQWYMVVVEMPDPDNRGFTTWGTVQRVQASGQEEAIEKAVQTAPVLTEFVPAGEMKFMAIPVRDVPTRRVIVTLKEFQPA